MATRKKRGGRPPRGLEKKPLRRPRTPTYDIECKFHWHIQVHSRPDLPKIEEFLEREAIEILRTDLGIGSITIKYSTKPPIDVVYLFEKKGHVIRCGIHIYLAKKK